MALLLGAAFVTPSVRAQTEPAGPPVPVQEAAAQASPNSAITTPASERVATADARPLFGAGGEEQQEAATQAEPMSDTAWMVRTALALGAVLGLAYILRKAFGSVSKRVGGLAGQLGAGGKAPSGVVFVLGRYPVGRGHTVVLMKVDRRVLVLDQTATGFKTLCEMTDPEEVASILTKTRDEEGESASSQFSRLMNVFEKDSSLIADEQTSFSTPRSARASAQVHEDQLHEDLSHTQMAHLVEESDLQHAFHDPQTQEQGAPHNPADELMQELRRMREVAR